jgi:hypothetical protein
VVAPTRVNGGISSGIAVAPGTLADDDVDPEVLHRHVEHLLGRPGHPVDLVEEQHLALGQRGDSTAARSPACWIAGPLVIRSGAPSSDGDDHRQRRLAEPGRAGQQHVVGQAGPRARPPRARGRAARAPAPGRRTRRGSSAAAHASTAASSTSTSGATRREPSSCTVVVVGQRGPGCAGPRLQQRHATSGVVGPASSSHRRPRRRPRPWRTSRDRPALRAPARPGRCPQPEPDVRSTAEPAGRPSRSLSSSTRRWAPLRPTPAPSAASRPGPRWHRAAQRVRLEDREHRLRQPRTRHR